MVLPYWIIRHSHYLRNSLNYKGIDKRFTFLGTELWYRIVWYMEIIILEGHTTLIFPESGKVIQYQRILTKLFIENHENCEDYLYQIVNLHIWDLFHETVH
jgi:hypothetical protein